MQNKAKSIETKTEEPFLIFLALRRRVERLVQRIKKSAPPANAAR
ncbi:hypothetical protein [Paraburkholderia sp. Tr-20389]|nr:hypothetical protein [Paraburkholderia sp. Tr-20389]